MYKTLIKGDHYLGNNEYVVGKVSGIMSVLCDGDERPFVIREDIESKDRILTTKCTADKYAIFVGAVTKHYPADLFIFDYKDE